MTAYQYFYKLGCFTREELLQYAGNPKKADDILYALKKKGLVVSVKRNLYVVVSGETKQLLASPFEIASKITEDSYISHHSAFEYYGMANQVFGDVYVSSSARFNNFEFDGKTYVYVMSKVNSGKIRDGKVHITDIERTIIDSIKNFEKIGGLEELLRCLDMVTFADEHKLLAYLSEYEKQFLYQKTGYILSHFQRGMKLSNDFFAECMAQIYKSVRYLYNGIQYENPVLYPEWQLYAPKNLLKIIDEGGDAIV